jgi:RimJ/RimL family protein N-acetyltransferase
MISLRRNDSAEWTDKWVYFYQKHEDAYNVPGLEELQKKLHTGKNCPRVIGKNEYYEVLRDEEVIGELHISVGDSDKELVLGILDEFSNHGYGAEAIQYYLQHFLDSDIKVRVEVDNPLRNRIIRMLRRIGFTQNGVSPLVYTYKK